MDKPNQKLVDILFFVNKYLNLLNREKMNYLINSKGNRQLILDGYVFNKQKTNATNTITWDCVERRRQSVVLFKLGFQLKRGQISHNQHISFT